jgi:hypothetical protein
VQAQELANLLWACAKTQHSAKSLFNAAEEEARQLLLQAESDKLREHMHSFHASIACLSV